MLGLVIGLGSWALSLSDHYKKQLLVNVYFCTELRCGAEASDAADQQRARTLLASDAAGEDRPLHLEGARRSRIERKKHPEMVARACPTTRSRTRSR